MTPERWQQIERLYHDALELAPEYRLAFLDRACAGDDELRREVESLLASHDEAASFIEKSPDDVAAGMLAEEPAHSVIGRTLGHYKIQSLIGAGGMGEVYRAHDTRLDRDVAVKILPEHLADHPDTLKRFEREAKAVAALSHPNILSIFDFGTEEGLSYAVMELLEGETLRERLNRAPVNWREAVEIGVAITEGLAAAHAKGIIHRDLKPENIFLTSSGLTSGAGVKILDFGIARVKHTVTPEAETVTGTATRPGTIMGTIGYMSPEQVRGEQADAPSDIFSLGCVLYEIVSGQRPFARATAAEMIAAILDAEPPALTQTGKKIPAEMEQVIRHCLQKKPGGRYQSARDLAFDLKAMLSGGSITAPARTRRRTGVAVWIGAAAVIAVLVMAAWLFWRIGRERAIDSIAVLPLANVSGDAEIEYLSDGITEAIINSLSQLPQLSRVIARSTVSSYKGKEVDPRKVGQELNVRAVLTGKLTQRGADLIIGAELVNATDGSRLWGQQYSRKLADVMAVQAEIARQISEKLHLKLTGAEQKRLTKQYTENTEAYHLYLKGRYHSQKFSADGFRKGIEYLNQAVELDPTYALAYAGLATSYYDASGSVGFPPKETMPKVKAAASRALQLDEALAEAHTALALFNSQYEWNWAEAEKEYKRAIELTPNYASAHQYYGMYLVVQGRLNEAIVELTEAREFDPLTPYIGANLAWAYYLARRPDEAITQLRKIVETNPDFVMAHNTLGLAYLQKAMFEQAVAEFNKARELDPENPYGLVLLGHVFASQGKRGEAEKILDALKERMKKEAFDPTFIAIVCAALGDRDQAFAWLEKAYEARYENLLTLKVEPLFDNLRSDPRYTDLLRRLNLAP